MVSLKLTTTGKPWHYDLQAVKTYNPDKVLIIGERNLGKTFTVREDCLKQFLLHGERFCGLARHDNRIPDLAAGYFDKIFEETELDSIHKIIDGRQPRTKLENKVIKFGLLKPGSDKHEWVTLGYWADIAVKQHAKERTFQKVRNFIFDEAIIEPEDLRYNRYLDDEYGNLMSVVNSVSRERVNGSDKTAGQKPRIYLLGNAADLINPWFKECGIYEVPDYGLHWYLNKTFLLDYVNPADYDTKDRATNTVAGRALAHREENRMVTGNEFLVNNEFVAKRPKGARYECGFIYRGEIYGVWVDYSDGLTYVDDRFIKNIGAPMYALTTKDNRINYFAANESRKAMRELIERYSYGLMRFETIAKRERFTRMLKDFGVK